ncbi:MAG TPA: hypothetical protein EYG88_11970 [Desulfocapsa sulfexigens]|nr:hypothetical protein [Desulfocapsa sulfexigens]
MMQRFMIYFFAIFLCSVPLTASAGDKGLYAKKPPADAAFFRVLNASDNSALKVLLDGEKLVTVAPLRVSGYGFTVSSVFNLTLNGKTISVPATAKSMITLVWNGQDYFTVAEETFSSKKKARLKIFNVGTKPVSLKTADGKTTVIEKVPSRHYGYRDVNALNMSFAFYTGDAKLLATEKISLQKGRVTTLFLVNNGSIPLYVQTEEQR